MNNIFRNFVQTLRRFPLSSSLSLAGLTVAFTVFMVIAIQVRYEFGFDKNYANSGRIYCIEYTSNDAYTMLLPQPFLESVIHYLPQVEAYAL